MRIVDYGTFLELEGSEGEVRISLKDWDQKAESLLREHNNETFVFVCHGIVCGHVYGKPKSNRGVCIYVPHYGSEEKWRERSYETFPPFDLVLKDFPYLLEVSK